MPIITISRGTFSGGQGLAERLAERLGYECISREGQLEGVAATYQVSPEKLTAAMDRPPSFWERLVSERGIYLNYVRATMREHARRGELVFHGFAGHLLLPDVSHIISIRVIEDIEDRVQTAMRRHGFQRKDAVAHIKKLDRERGEWARFLWGVDWQDASLYTAVINITRTGTDGACDVVATMAGLPAFQPTPASMRVMEDAALASRVWVRLATDESIGGAGLDVTSIDGIVTIRGSVGSPEVADAIEEVAAAVEGVREVRSETTVAAPVYDVPG